MFQDINDNKGFKFKGHVTMDVVYSHPSIASFR